MNIFRRIAHTAVLLPALLIGAAFAFALAFAGCGHSSAPPAPPGLARHADASPAPMCDGTNVVTCQEPDACEYDDAADDMVCPVRSATTPVNVLAMEQSVWGYYTGSQTAGLPSMTMFQPDIKCSPLPLGNNLFAYRIPSYQGGCLWDSGSQVQQSPWGFWATYEIWQDRAPVPGVQMPWYATLAVNFICQAAYERVNYSYAQAYPYCSGAASSTVPFVRRWIHDTYYPGTPFWQ